jgi:diguanylate cyclase (GGDEF)-like protein
MVEDLTERHLAESALREKAMQLVELVTAAASEASTDEEVLQICLNHVCDRTGWPVGHVYSVTPTDPPELIPTEIWHSSDPERFRVFRQTTMSLRFRSGQGLPGRVLASSKPLWVDDLARTPLAGRANAAASAGLLGAFACPVVVGNEIIGVLEFFSTQRMEPDRLLENAVAKIGRQLGRVVERKRVDALRAHQALHDPLTDLPNRLLFVDRMGHALSRLGRTSDSVALLFLDLDGFKEINDNFGHDVGDRVLIALTQRIGRLLRPEDTVARFGGDELTILCEDLSGEEQAIVIAERLLEVFNEPLPIDGLKLVVSASIGIAMASGPNERPETLLRNADSAMYRAKERGGECYQLYNVSMRKRQVQRHGMEWSLRQALDARQLRVFYQPCLDLRDGSVAGVEALVRWQHPERGLLGPDQFIPFAEESGLVVPVGHWVFEESCRQSARWRQHYPAGDAPRLWVNLSSRQLDAPDLVERLSRVLEEARMKPSEFGLEITESVLLDDDAKIGELLKLESLGIALSIDDFGTGYSSLNCIKRFPVTQIKLDRSFVAGVGDSPQDTAIVSGMIKMGHALGLVVVAEGVETAAQLEKLVAIECDRAQGFYFASPVPAEAITDLIAKLSSSYWCAREGV